MLLLAHHAPVLVGMRCMCRFPRNTRAEEARSTERRAAGPNAVWTGEWSSFPPGALRTTGELPDSTRLDGTTGTTPRAAPDAGLSPIGSVWRGSGMPCI
ncbi:hypothetical protein GCM10022202_20080 [Microbacterium marinilacus]|uniref:Uncharacterized protein n=1 Tax=Microbacterium marinilacus TaxID=415209 RepID=A0ABP7BHI9_9MICO